ncbi:MAG: hypothetical protein DRP45_07395 [Candidatus Zixiibacteriota bacterium]|nr:MAG: hypothetical protein DRP45_07395 [candidate division Zixibacteria bacterium]
MSRRVKLVLMLTVVLAVAAPGVSAQVTGTIQAIATVAASLNVQGTSSLDFGTVVPGVDLALATTSIEAGEFTIQSGPAGAEVQFAFTLPTELTSGANSLAIAFATTDAAYATDALRTQNPPTAVVNPLITTTANLAADGGMAVWIGGEVSPTAVQAAGDYSGDIEISVTLTGN